MQQNEPAPLAVWGGVECSHIRIGDVERDQCAEAGHNKRLADLDLIAGLGLRTLRYPMLWATIERPDGSLEFGQVETRFHRLRDLGIAPIAGFLHHGSGPGGLTPADPTFAARLARFATAVAERFDWIEDFTPINEPVTTARFSCLYGHWHPHRRDEASFLRMAFGSAVATIAAMRALRARNPRARLIQTEDFGRTFATPDLHDQADYENARRFLGIDFLIGQVTRNHRFWPRLVDAGVSERDLDGLAEAPCPPDVIGIDHYLTSDRFLDSRPERHPGAALGGNGRESYVDVAAAHLAELEDETGPLPRLRELHTRYELPLAITEVHNGCTREEQLRWLLEAWEAALVARTEGADVVAITSWALLGTRDWNSLMVAQAGHYESGAFDLRSDPPRLTAVGRAVAALAKRGSYSHHLLELAGWWRRATPRVVGLPHLSVAGAASDVARFVACCRQRRIPAMTHSAARSPSATILANVRIQNDGPSGALRFTCAPTATPPEAQHLVVEAPCGVDFDCAAHAFLDLMIDLEAGFLQLEALGPANQYTAIQATATLAAVQNPRSPTSIGGASQ